MDKVTFPGENAHTRIFEVCDFLSTKKIMTDLESKLPYKNIYAFRFWYFQAVDN